MKPIVIMTLTCACVAGWSGSVVAQARPARPYRREIRGFDFSPHGVWRGRAQRVRATRSRMLAARQFGALNAKTRVSSAATVVAGSIVEPVILIRFQDTQAGAILADTLAYDSVLFATAPPGLRPYTVRTYYQQMSNGLMTITGKAFGFVTLDQNEVAYTGAAGTCTGNPFGTSNCNGLFSGAAYASMQSGLQEALGKLDASVDWTQFTSHGDTLDLVVFAQAAKDGACGGFPNASDASNNHLWAHRSQLETPYVTHDGLKVVDYIMESAVGGASSCDTTQIMPVGTVAHETGHGFDLPDLYDTQGSGEGAGEFSLMGSGNYTSPYSPSRMDVWSLSQLGWITVVPLPSAGTSMFGGTPVSDTTFYIRPTTTNPRGEYYLLENRQPLESDTAMLAFHCQVSGLPASCGGGLLIWHVDSMQLADHGFLADNAVNSGPIPGLELEQSDGKRDLDLGRNRGDAGDPFPGATANVAFLPAMNGTGLFAGFQVDMIQQVATTGTRPMSFRLQFGPVTLATTAVVSQLLKGSGLTQTQRDYLDAAGNRSGLFDVGDFLAFVATTGAPAPPIQSRGATPVVRQ